MLNFRSNTISDAKVVWTCDCEVPGDVIKTLGREIGKYRYRQWFVGEANYYGEEWVAVDIWLKALGAKDGDAIIILVDW